MAMNQFARQVTAFAASSFFDKAKIKGTFDDFDAPKEKHIQTMIWSLSGQNPETPESEAFRSLVERMQKKKEWKIVLKTLIVFHRAMDDGDQRCIDTISSNTHAFNLANFLDKSTTLAWDHSVFIRKYSFYLEEKIHNLSRRTSVLRKGKAREDSVFNNMLIEELRDEIPPLQAQLRALLDVFFDGKQVTSISATHGVTLAAMQLLLKDCLKLYRYLNQGIIAIIDKYFTSRVSDARACLDIYKKFIADTDLVIRFCDYCKGIPGIVMKNIPSFNVPPESFLQTLEDYIKADDEDDVDDSPRAGRKQPSSRSTNPSSGRRSENQVTSSHLFELGRRDDSAPSAATKSASTVNLSKSTKQSKPAADLLDLNDAFSSPAPVTSTDSTVATAAKDPFSLENDFMSALSSPPPAATVPSQQPFGSSFPTTAADPFTTVGGSQAYANPMQYYSNMAPGYGQPNYYGTGGYGQANPYASQAYGGYPQQQSWSQPPAQAYGSMWTAPAPVPAAGHHGYATQPSRGGNDPFDFNAPSHTAQTAPPPAATAAAPAKKDPFADLLA
eukprot:GILJ01003138.1.p1 GENE.GILJ01003138.1~~GILJ01003138.1.p1  ORF type:complete len:556 (+),score=104.74 GILJ01003138.1:97-1764(+)